MQLKCKEAAKEEKEWGVDESEKWGGGQTGLWQYVCINSLALSLKCSAKTDLACARGTVRHASSDVCA